MSTSTFSGTIRTRRSQQTRRSQLMEWNQLASAMVTEVEDENFAPDELPGQQSHSAVPGVALHGGIIRRTLSRRFDEHRHESIDEHDHSCSRPSCCFPSVDPSDAIGVWHLSVIQRGRHQHPRALPSIAAVSQAIVNDMKFCFFKFVRCQRAPVFSVSN